MKPTLWLVCLIPSMLAIPALAQSRFDGTWKIDPNESQPSSRHFDYLLNDGIYHCPTCDPPLEVRADGQDHKVSGDPCSDAVNVKVVDDRTIEETDKRNGKTVGTSKMTVSSDGNTATSEWSQSCNANGDFVTGKDIMSRLEKGPPGSHAISGSWKISKRLNRSENAIIITLKLQGDTFSFTDPTNQHYTAKLDGTEAPFEGDLSHTMVSVRRVAENTIEETNKREGKVVEIWRFTVSDDGTTLTISTQDKIQGGTQQFALHRQ
jgi:hypothetical protein